MNKLGKESQADIAELPEAWLKDLRWIFGHFDFAVEICQEEILTEADRENLLAFARKQNDHLLYLLVELEQIVNHKKPLSP